ncbi:MAG: hypothetical protein COB53_07395 [Elusimicrobia bacterium]|nr:MAG: hypothetical protein COB53_07395 [Elusimicrobiota bacterium]
MASLYAVIFFIGAVVLILESLGSILLSPYFGTSVTTWSALITTTLAALAVGAAFGGWLADREKPRSSLSWLFVGAALWLFAVLPVREFLLPAITGLGLRAGALAGASLLLFVPLAALGAATPLVVRLVVTAAGETGRVYGVVSAVSTLGGCVGALGSGFWLLPYWTVGAVLGGTAVLLIVSAAIVRWAVPA